MQSGTDFKLILVSDNDAICAAYLKHFRGERNVEIKKATVSDAGPADLLILPLCSGLGLLPASSVHRDLTALPFAADLGQACTLLPNPRSHTDAYDYHNSYLGDEFFARVRQGIQKRYMGEQTPGTAFLVKTKATKAAKLYQGVCITALFRILTPATDHLAWLDPVYVPVDWAYTAFRSSLVSIVKYRTEGDVPAGPCTAVCPDFFSFRKDSPDGTSLPEKEIDQTVRQMWLAYRAVVAPPGKPREWADGILLMREILNKDQAASASSSGNELAQMLASGELERRGILTTDEAELVCQWIRDPSNKERQTQAAKALAASLRSSDEAKISLPRRELCTTVADKERGCLGALLELVQAGVVTIHNEIALEEIVWEDEIGSGTAGSVFRGTYKKKPVAVKRFKGVLPEDFLKELSLMSVVQHPNLVECYGGCTKKDSPFIVQELMQANISDILRIKTITLDLGIKLRVALDVAMGMSYLHNHCNLIHRDLKSLNLLASVNNDVLTIKVCDFGVSRVVDRRKTMTGNVGTVSWIAPEIFEQRKYTEKADVYSFGIVLWELYTRKVPFTDIHSFSIPVAVIKGDRPPVPKDCPPPLKKLIRQCWDSKPAKRPALSKVIETIQKIYEQLPPLARSQTTINMQPLTKSGKKSKPGKSGAGGRHQGRRLKEALDSEYDDDASAMLTNGPAGAAVGTIDEASSNTLSSPSTSTIDSGGATIDSSNKRQDSSADLFDSISDSISVSGTTSYSESPATSPSVSKKHASSLDSPDSKSLSRKLSDKSTGAHAVGVKLAHTVTCQIPDQWAPPIARLEIQVNKYFSRLKQDLDLGTITVGEERYLLFRGHSLAVDFLKMIQASFEFDNEHDSVEFAQNFLYDLGSGIGKNDAANFLNTVAVDDPLARQNLGLVVVAYTGMAFVSLLPESSYNPKKPEDELMAYEFVYSFEADSWAKKGRKDIDFTTCMMSAGYLSGWGEGATGHVRATAELECCSKGDHRCLFVRSSPLRLESNVRKFVEEHKIDKPEPIPRFLRNRSDTLPPSMQKKSERPDDEDEADLNWFEAGFKKLWKRFNSTKQPERVEAGSPKPLPKLTAKRFSPPELSIDEIDRRASQELNSFFIDPTTATVEMAEERCVLLRGDALAYGFNEMVGELFKGEDRHTLSNQFSQKFLFELGRTIGSSNQSWFVEKIGLGPNAIERAWALPVNMAYFGWCDLVIRSGLSYKELQKQTENFKIICDVNNSFEAASYLKHKKKKDYKSPVCHMHAGYISGWFEASFRTKVVAVETLCKAQGHPHCQFVIGHATNIKKHISQQFYGAVNSALSTSVLPLLAKFKEKRRESGKLKKEELIGGGS